MKRWMHGLAVLGVVSTLACDDAASPATSDANTPDGTDTIGAADTLGASETSETGEAVGTDPSGELTLSAVFEAPATTGQNHLTIALRDEAGNGVEAASIAVVPTMPMMGHGSTETPQVSDQGDGTYDAFPVTFQMPGSWRVAITATAGGVIAGLTLDVVAR